MLAACSKLKSPSLFIILLMICGSYPILIHAQPATPDGNVEQVQVLTGRIEAGQNLKYLLSDLRAGQTLYVYAADTSGNLDPVIALAAGNQPVSVVDDLISEVLNVAATEGVDPVKALFEQAGGTFLVSNDDGGMGYDAVIAFHVPETGEYTLFLGGSPQSETFGDYQLMIGINAPAVLQNAAVPTGAEIARLDRSEVRYRASIQAINGSITEDNIPQIFTLRNFNKDEVLQVFVEATAGNLRPWVALQDFSGKYLLADNFGGDKTQASLEFTFAEDVTGYQLLLSSCCESSRSTGDYHLLIGANTPVVLTGGASELGASVLAEPTPVSIGLQLDQITNVDQIAESFDIVATLRMEWQDPARAFNPDTCQCTLQHFVGDAFGRFVQADSTLTWPDFILFNQQGRRDTQNRGVTIRADGSVIYAERFTATLQAPDFDFRAFPFDRQDFYVHVDSIFSDRRYVFQDLEGFTHFGEQLGEEEWIVSDEETIISSHDDVSRFSFKFSTHRHLNFYVFRILLPIGLLIVVSWITFFLKDYGKRVDVAGANLLVFVAFNFTISAELPRLGYLTFMDIILISTFVVTSLTIAFNVYLRRLENNDRASFADRIDKIAIWLYPIGYAIVYVVSAIVFFG